MYCRKCGQTGESSNNSLITLECNHTFHENCITGRVCPICSENVDCAICMNPIDDDVEPLTGCIHRFHPTCIIDFLRRPDSNGRCPLCRRNPFEDNEEYEDEEYDAADDEWTAIKKIREAQIQLANTENRKKRKHKEIESMNSRLKKARETRNKAASIRKKFLESRSYAKMKKDLKKMREDASEQAKISRQKITLFRQKQREIERLTPTVPFWDKGKEERIKTEVGSKVNPLWQYKDDSGAWSNRMSSTTIRKLSKDGVIHDQTLIRHPELPHDVIFQNIKYDFDRKYI